MAITFDPAKRAKTLRERAIDFVSAADVVAGPIFTFEDEREDYGEIRLVTIGDLNGRMVVVGWTPRGEDRHVFTMRKANARETKRYGGLLA